MPRLPLLLLALVPLASCAAEKVDTPNVERTVQRQLSKQVHDQSVRVQCPDGIDWKQGQDFHCVARDSRGTQVRITVTMESDEGGFTWQVSR